MPDTDTTAADDRFIGWMADRYEAKSMCDVDGVPEPWERRDALDLARQTYEGFAPEERQEFGRDETGAHAMADTDMSYWENG